MTQESAGSKSNQPTIDYAKLWDQALMSVFRDYELRFGILEKYPKLEQKGAMKFLTGKRQFVDVDEERGLLIGSLGWFDEDDAFWKHVSFQDKWAAIEKLQEQIGNYAIQEQWDFRLIIDPVFADSPDFRWLCGPKPQRQPAVQRTEVVEVVHQPEVVHVGHLMTKPRYPIRRPKNPEAEFRRDLGGGKTIKIIPLPRDVKTSDGTTEEKREIPYGLMCTQLEILAYNVFKSTNARFLAFDSPREILGLIGYTANTKNYRTLNQQIMNLVWSTCILSDQNTNEVRQIQPFLFASLWDEEPARMVTYEDPVTGKTITKRNPGSRRLSRVDQRFLIPSVILLNPVWLAQVSKHYHNVDLKLLNRLTGSAVTYTLLLKCYELGTRPSAGLVPYWGANGLANELGLKDETPQNRRNARKKIIESFAWIRRETDCPFTADKDALRYSEWRPLHGKHRAQLEIPEATRSLIQAAQAANADAESLIRDQRVHTLEVLENKRDQAISGETAVKEKS